MTAWARKKVVNTPSPTSLVIFRNAPDSADDQRGSLPSDYAREWLRAERYAAHLASSERAREIHRQLAASYVQIARRG